MSLQLGKLNELLECNTFFDLKSRVAEIVTILGYDHFIFFLCMDIVGQPTQDFIINGYPKEWFELNQIDVHDYIDPISSLCKLSHRPVACGSNTDNDAVFISPKCKRDSGFGIKCCVNFPVHGSARREFGLLNLSVCSQSESKTPSSETLGQGQLLANYLYESVQNIAKKPLNILMPSLTRREHECLRWVASGKSSWEISRIIKTSERTVYYHVNNVLTKLNVVNRQQAIAKGMSLGLL